MPIFNLMSINLIADAFTKRVIDEPGAFQNLRCGWSFRKPSLACLFDVKIIRSGVMHAFDSKMSPWYVDCRLFLFDDLHAQTRHLRKLRHRCIFLLCNSERCNCHYHLCRYLLLVLSCFGSLREQISQFRCAASWVSTVQQLCLFRDFRVGRDTNAFSCFNFHSVS